MCEPIFKSKLSMDQVENNFKDFDFYSAFVEGLEEALAYKHGRASAETIVRKSSLPNISVPDLRKELSLTQKGFANILGVSPRTVEAWEIGKATPTPTAKKLMFLISEDPSLINKLV